MYSPATIARGRVLAGLGNCITCHTLPGGIQNAGGKPIQTPFGVVYSTNITPDARTGIGAWSYPAFERAMRQGIHRDGSLLYPAFPYTSFTRASDADLQALYAWLMAQPAVESRVPETRLVFPRPVMALWNALFHRQGAWAEDPARAPAWNRGAYLVEGLGHCGACHTPRNLMGAERRGAHLAGGVAGGWAAPSLTSLSQAPIPWTEEDFFAYLRTGHSRFHGVAAGPMAPVVREMAALPDADVRAMAVYLASFNPAPADPQAREAQALLLEQRAEARRLPVSGNGARIFDGACAVCHVSGGAETWGVRPSLAVNSNLVSDSPDNLIRVILGGIATPARAELGAMPGFAASLDDAQMADLLAHLRQTYAPGRPAWTGLSTRVARLRDAMRGE